MKRVFAPQLLSSEDKARLFDNSVIVLDTNVLLRTYRWSTPTSDKFLEMLSDIQDRLWLPYQVGWEFFRNRTSVRTRVQEGHADRFRDLSALKKDLIEDNRARSHVAGNDEERQKFLSAIDSFTEYLKKENKALGKWATAEPDTVLRRILDLYEGRTAEAPSQKWFAKRSKEAESRFAAYVPPGYADVPRKISNVYGDYLLWRECMDFAKKHGTPMVIVTDDAKEDWWIKRGDTRVSPRPELLQEFHDRTHQHVIILSTEDFHSELTTRVGNADERKAAEAIRDEIAEPETPRRSIEEVLQGAREHLMRTISLNTDMTDWLALRRGILGPQGPMTPDLWNLVSPNIETDPRIFRSIARPHFYSQSRDDENLGDETDDPDDDDQENQD